jgi:hypothetical protein
MNQEARAAFIIAQAAMLNAEIAMMQAANQERQEQGKSIAYGEKQFHDTFTEYQYTIGYNSALEYLRDA